MRAGIVVVIALAAGCAEPPVQSKLIIMNAKVAADLAGRPEQFKGKTLIAKMWCVTRPAHGSCDLRDLGGWKMKFALVREYGVDLTLVATLPTDPARLTDAQAQQDEMFVTFICREGKLDEGNEIVRIAR